MPSGNITVTLRPLKFAFVVNPLDKKALLEVIQINSFLWGGLYNPIIPLQLRKPKYWDSIFKFHSQDVLDGYIEAYNPDIIVCTEELPNTLKIRDREVISLSQLLPDIANNKLSSYGINLIDVLTKYYQEEGRFLLKEPRRIILPKIVNSKYKLFLSSLFGNLPPDINEFMYEYFGEALEISRPEINPPKYIDYFKSANLYPIRITSFHVDKKRARSTQTVNHIFFMDSFSNIDIIDYWNLRATGCNAIPMPKQLIDEPDFIEFSRNFVINNFASGNSTPNSVTIIKSRTTFQNEAEVFYKKILHDSTKNKYSLQLWYPRIWDSFGREADKATCYSFKSKSKTIDIARQKEVTIESLTPNFMRQNDYNGYPRFANEIKLNIINDDGEICSQVLPNGGVALARLFVPYSLDWRCGNGMLIHCSKNAIHNNKLIFPEAHILFSTWLNIHGYNSKLSSSGLLAKSILKQIGGIWGLHFLANKLILKMLDNMSGGSTNLTRLLSSLKNELKVLCKDQFTKEELENLIQKNIWVLSESENSGENHSNLMKLLNQIIQKEKKHFTADVYLKNLIESNILRLGKELKCNKCQRVSWYSLQNFTYQIQCPKCAEIFSLPQESCEEIKWSYYSVGSLRQPRYAGGAYCVLLTLRFFSFLLDANTTPYLSFDANCGEKKIEADLAIFYQEKLSASENHLIFIESKSFNTIQEKDIQRMQAIADLFPKCVIVFASFKTELDAYEKKLITKFVNYNRKRWKNGDHETIVVVLGETELFCGDPFLNSAWERKGGMHKQCSKRYDLADLRVLSDCTLKIYLNLPSAIEYLEKNRK